MDDEKNTLIEKITNRAWPDTENSPKAVVGARNKMRQDFKKSLGEMSIERLRLKWVNEP